MINTTDILNAINRELVKKFNYTVYIDTMPENFERPSFFIGLTKESTIDKNINTVEKTKQFKIVCYEEKDENYNSNTLSIFKMMEDVCELFSSEKLSVDDRMLNISMDVNTDQSMDIIYIDVIVKFFDDRVREKKEFDTAEEVIVSKSIKGGI